MEIGMDDSKTSHPVWGSLISISIPILRKYRNGFRIMIVESRVAERQERFSHYLGLMVEEDMGGYGQRKDKRES